MVSRSSDRTSLAFIHILLSCLNSTRADLHTTQTSCAAYGCDAASNSSALFQLQFSSLGRNADQDALLPAQTNAEKDRMDPMWIHVAYATDARTSRGLLHSMLSLSRNLHLPNMCTIHVIVPAADEAAVAEQVSCVRQDLQTLGVLLPEVQLHRLEQLFHQKILPNIVKPYLNGVKTTWARLFIHELLPHAKKVIYLDTDTIVRRDIRQLWSMEMKQPLMASTNHCKDGLTKNKMEYYRGKGFDLTPYHIDSDECFFNAGVIVIDLYKWRLQQIPRVIDTLATNITDDQLLLNVVFKTEGRAFDEMDPRWNTVDVGTCLATDDRVDKSYILHWSGENASKPWYPVSQQHECVRKYNRHYDAYAPHRAECNAAGRIRSSGQPYTVMTVFGARRDRFPILASYLHKLQGLGLLDEIHLWDYTENAKDEAAFRLQASKLGAKILTPRPTHNLSKWADYYKYYTSYKPPVSAPGEVVIVKCDDDIVFIDVHRFPDFVEATAAGSSFMVHANIINTPVTAFYQQAHGALKGLDLEYPVTNLVSGSLPRLVKDTQKARALHMQFLERPHDFSWEGPCLGYHHPDLANHPEQGRMSINFFGVRLSQWPRVWRLVQQAHGDNHDGLSDEVMLTVNASAEGLKECILPSFNVVHLSFSSQHAIDSEVLPWYELLLKRQN